jgi:5,10-methylenetetrahydromethanopterin reductase
LFPDAEAGRFVDALVGAEAIGLDEVWVGDEGPARDPIALLAAAARATDRLRLALGVTNPYLRHPAITAAGMATVHELSGGRAVLGLGPGGQMALAPVGIRPTHHLRDSKQALRTIRAFLAGEAGEGYAPPRHAFSAPTLPVFVGARGERFNRWASAAADGVFLAGMAPTMLDDVVGWARSARPVEVALYLSACLDPSPDALEDVRPRMIYAFADAPAALRRRAGLDDGEVAAAAEALGQGEPGPAARLLPDVVVDLVLARGEDAAVAQLAAAARAHGPNSIGLALLGPDPLDQVERAGRVRAALAKELR